MNELEILFDLQDRVLGATRGALESRSSAELSRSARDDDGDTIFGIDIPAEEVLMSFCEELGREVGFLLMAEGIDPAGQHFGDGHPRFRLIVDPVDGSRGLMHDKRSAWCLAAIAEERGDATRMEDVRFACMTELPTTKQGKVDRMWATHAGRAEGVRIDLATGARAPLALRPSPETSLHNSFGTINDYFPGGKAILGRVAEAVLLAEMGGWNPDKANVFSDQYISSGGQLAEVLLGRDRFVMDIRPQVFAKMQAATSLCARPYDMCTTLIAQRAGAVVRQPNGSPFNPPLDITTNVSFAIFANQALADRMQPMIDQAMRNEELT